MLLLHAVTGLVGGLKYMTVQGGELLPCLWEKSGVGLGAVTWLTVKSWAQLGLDLNLPMQRLT